MTRLTAWLLLAALAVITAVTVASGAYERGTFFALVAVGAALAARWAVN